jgi:hypothetical protein
MADDKNFNQFNDGTVSGNLPDVFDATIGALLHRQGVDSTRATLIRSVPLFGIGGSMSYSVQTFRQAGDILEEDPEKGTIRRGPPAFTVALEVAHRDNLRRIILPHEVLDVIIRQRDSLTTTALRRSAKASAKARKARGIVPDVTKMQAARKRKRKEAGKK